MRSDRDPETTNAIPTGRARRTAKLGGLLGGEMARAYATKAANLVRSQDERNAASSPRCWLTSETLGRSTGI